MQVLPSEAEPRRAMVLAAGQLHPAAPHSNPLSAPLLAAVVLAGILLFKCQRMCSVTVCAIQGPQEATFTH